MKLIKELKFMKKIKIFIKNSPNIEDQIINSKKFAEGLKKIIDAIDSNTIHIGKDFIEPSTIAIPWIDNWSLYKEINEDVFARYRKDEYSNGLLSIKTFLDNINSGKTKNKKDARKEFRTVKKNVKSEALKTIVKDLEQAIFGNNDSNEKSSEDDKSPPKEYSAETDEYLKYLEEQEKGRKKFSDEYDSSGSGLNKKGKGLKVLTKK